MRLSREPDDQEIDPEAAESGRDGSGQVDTEGDISEREKGERLCIVDKERVPG
jgi:hypothetical protein